MIDPTHKPATDTAREAAERNIRIYTKCPACHNDTLTVSDKHLLCTWITCPDPTLIGRIDDSTAALRREVEVLRARLKSIYDATEGYADGAPDASDHDKLCNEISALAKL